MAAMEQVCPSSHDVRQHEEYSDTEFLDAVRNGTKEQVVQCLSLLKSSIDIAERKGEDNDEITTQAYRQTLLKALEKRNAGAVWNLIVEGKETDVKSLETLNKVCAYVAEHERLKESGFFKCLWGKLKSQIRCNGGCGCCSKCCEDEQRQTEFQNEEEQQWIKILSDPLYISLEWLWRNNPNSDAPPPSENDETKGKVSKLEDAIEAALHDAHLLEKIALYEHNYSRDEYTRRAEEYEKFAADVVEGSNLTQLHVIMDVKGTGCLLQERPKDFNESLSLLKIAADKKRKRFVASPKCQYILNEIIYYEWPHWQNMSRVTKIAWSFFIQLIFVVFSCLVYVPIRLFRKSSCCDKDNRRWWGFKEFYEHPYSKFINHTMSYLVFLAMVFVSSFEEEFGTTVTGLVWIDYVVLGFVLGLFFQEILEAWRQGFHIYMSKWWNVVDTLIILTFLVSYAVWIFSWVRFGKWKPQKPGFVVADVLYASAIVMAFFHLTHIFQIDSVLGPLQLSLYKMLKDVWRFLVIFLLLYIAFTTGLVKVYSYYVASQIELRKQNNTIYQESHPYTNHFNALNALFWLLLGFIEEDKIAVDDPAFYLTSILGRLFFVVYVVCTVIVALNMLIAMMNNSFGRIMDNTDIEWKFSRARMWLECIDKGNTMPVPINIVYYTFEVPRRCIRASMDKCQCCNQQDEKQAMRKERMETMKDLIVKYLKENYFGKNETEKDGYEETEHFRDAATGRSLRSKASVNIQDDNKI